MSGDRSNPGTLSRPQDVAFSENGELYENYETHANTVCIGGFVSFAGSGILENIAPGASGEALI